MINNASSSSAAVINITSNGLRHRRKTDQPIIQITNTERKMETGPSYECYQKFSKQELAGYAALGAGTSMAAATVVGAGIPVIIGVGIGYSAISAAMAKGVSEGSTSLRMTISQIKYLKLKLE